MQTTEATVYVKDPTSKSLYDKLNGYLADVDFCEAASHCATAINMAVHDRRSGITRMFSVENIHMTAEQSSAVGGHCHWDQLNVDTTDGRFVITPNVPGDAFRAWCNEAESLASIYAMAR